MARAFIGLEALWLAALLLGWVQNACGLDIPSTLPTRGPPTQMAPAAGPYYYHTYHSGPDCASTPSHYTVESYQINACMPADDFNPSYFSMTCRQSTYGIQNTIRKTVYAAGDAACAGAPAFAPAVVARSFSCEMQPRDAGYMLSTCGDIPTAMRAHPQVVVKAYAQRGDPRHSTAACYSPNVVTRGYLLGVCSLYFQDGKKKPRYRRKFTLVSAVGSTIVLAETRYVAADNRCMTSYASLQWSYSIAQAGCTRDPLDSSMAYIQAMYYDGNSALNWAEVDAFIRNKMIPTAAPTTRPTVLPTQTAKPTPMPTSVPTTAPTVSPLVLSLDAASWSAGTGNWVDSVGGRAFVMYGTSPPVYSASNGGTISFTTSNSNYAQGPPLPLLSTFTVEVWHYYTGTNTGSYAAIITDIYTGGKNNFVLGSHYNNVGLLGIDFLGTAGEFSAPPPNGAPSTAISAGNWYHIVGTYTGSAIALYINGVLFSTSSASGTPKPGLTGIYLMRRWDFADYWGGKLGIVNVYNVGLSAAAVAANYDANKARFGLT